MSTWTCGCDPDFRYRGGAEPIPYYCENYPDCTYGRATMTVDISAAGFDAIAKVSNETIVTDPTTGGQKGQKLARFSLLPYDVLWLVAEHFGRGACKYADRNWEQGYRWSLSKDALDRHLAQFWQREDWGTDPKLPGKFRHIVAAAWHCLVLAAFSLRGAGTDDRPQSAPIRYEEGE